VTIIASKYTSRTILQPQSSLLLILYCSPILHIAELETCISFDETRRRASTRLTTIIAGRCFLALLALSRKFPSCILQGLVKKASLTVLRAVSIPSASQSSLVDAFLRHLNFSDIVHQGFSVFWHSSSRFSYVLQTSQLDTLVA